MVTLPARAYNAIHVRDDAIPDRRKGGGSMETRAAQLRARDRKVLAWSLIAAVVVHLVAFVLVPAFRTKPIATWGLRPQATRESNEGVTRVEVLFGPPTISAPDGTT